MSTPHVLANARFYNQTEYSGLETDILNSYTNALLQALHYTLPIRAVARGHICVDCKKEHCLLCEAGFLFRMLEDAQGINCQASNFSRAFSATPQGESTQPTGLIVASALGLSHNATTPCGLLIQNFNRWLLSTFSTEAMVEGFSVRSDSSAASPMDQVLGIETKTTNTCVKCGFVSSRDAIIHAIDLAYPKKVSKRAERLLMPDIGMPAIPPTPVLIHHPADLNQSHV